MVAPRTPDEKSAELIDALVDYVNEQLTGDRFVRWVHEEVTMAMAAADRLTLADVVTPQQVRGVAIKYALEWRIEETFLDLVGDIATRIHSRLYEPSARFDLENGIREAATRIESVPAFQRLAGAIYRSEFVRRAAAALVYQAAVDALKGGRGADASVRGLAKVFQFSSSLAERILPDAEQRADALLHTVSEQVATMVTRDKADPVDAARNLVAAITQSADVKAFGELTSTIEASDVEDFLVVAFELIRDARTTRPIRTAIEEGINVFFERYSNFTLAQLLNEMGITTEDMIEEALRFAPRPIAALREAGILEEIIRRRFAGFAESDRVRALLADDADRTVAPQ